MGNLLRITKSLVTFRRPRMALIAVIVAAFALSVALVPDASVEKFGYLIAMTIGVGFIMHAGKALMSEFGSLAVLLAVLGLSMVSAAVFATPDSVFAASALEEEASVIAGAILGLFSKLEDG